MDAISKHEGTPYAGRHDGEEGRDVFTAEVDHGASIIRESPSGAPVIAEPVFRITGSGESRGGTIHSGEWRWGTGTGLRVARSSIPALMRVLADLMEADTSY